MTVDPHVVEYLRAKDTLFSAFCSHVEKALPRVYRRKRLSTITTDDLRSEFILNAGPGVAEQASRAIYTLMRQPADYEWDVLGVSLPLGRDVKFLLVKRQAEEAYTKARIFGSRP